MLFGLWQAFVPQSKVNQLVMENIGNRPVFWQESILGIKEKPLLGWGQENYHIVNEKYFNPIVYSPGRGNETWTLHPHNSFLEILVNGGIVGFILYLLVIVFLIRNIYVLYKKQIISSQFFILSLGLIFAYILQNQMIYDSIISFVMFFLLIAIIAGLSDFTDENNKIKKSKIFKAVLIIIVIIIVWIFSAFLPAAKAREFKKMANATSQERTDKYEHLFHSIGSYAINTDAGLFTSGLISSYSAKADMIKNNPNYTAMAINEINSLVKETDLVLVNHPYDYRLALSLVEAENLQIFLEKTPDADLISQTKKYAEKAISLSPTDPQVYLTYANTFIYSHDLKTAHDMLDKAVALNPEGEIAQTAKVNFEKFYNIH